MSRFTTKNGDLVKCQNCGARELSAFVYPYRPAIKFLWITIEPERKSYCNVTCLVCNMEKAYPIGELRREL